LVFTDIEIHEVLVGELHLSCEFTIITKAADNDVFEQLIFL